MHACMHARCLGMGWNGMGLEGGREGWLAGWLLSLSYTERSIHTYTYSLVDTLRDVRDRSCHVGCWLASCANLSNVNSVTLSMVVALSFFLVDHAENERPRKEGDGRLLFFDRSWAVWTNESFS